MTPYANIVISKEFFPKIGGAHLWLYEVYRRWPSKATFVTTNYATDPDHARNQQEFDRLNCGAIEIIRENFALEETNLFDWRCLAQYRAVLKRIKQIAGDSFTYLHCCRAVPEGLIGLLVKRMRPGSSKLVIYAHGEEILVAQTSRQLKLIARLVYSWSDLIIANSESTRNLVKKLCPGANVVRIHPGVDPTSFTQAKSEASAYRLQWQWPADTVIVSTMARMEPRKNHAMVLRAIAELRKEGLSLGYVCGGDGEEKSKLVAMVGDLGLRDSVRFAGTVNDQVRKKIYAASDIFAMPSIQCGAMIEGFGIVFLEAAAAGIPSISGNTGGQAEAVLHGTTGLVINGTILDDVKKAIRVLAENKSLRERMGREGVKWALEHDWAKVVEKTFSAISALHGRSLN